jgi:hypothetical protein
MNREDYVLSLPLKTPDIASGALRELRSAASPQGAASAAVNMGALLTFVGDLDQQGRSDVLQSIQLGQRAADAGHDRFAQTEAWYEVFTDVLKRVGWVTQQVAEVTHDQKSGKVSIDRSAIQLLSSFASQNALSTLSSALDALRGMSDEHGVVSFFRYNGMAAGSGNIQIGVAERDPNGATNLALGAFKFKSEARSGSFLAALVGRTSVEFWARGQKMTLDDGAYAEARDAVRERLGDAENYVANLAI